MEPVQRKTRSAFHNGPQVDVMSVSDELTDIDDFNEEGVLGFLDGDADSMVKPNTKTDEQIKIAGLKAAIKIAKLVSGADVKKIIEIAGSVSLYIKFGKKN